MALTKLEKFQRFIPSFYRPDLNPIIRGLLYAWAEEDDLIQQSIQDAKEQIYVKTARLQFLDALGSNVGVFRPAAVNLSDEQFRKLIPALSFAPKQVKTTIQKVLDVFFEENNPNVFVAEVNPNEIVIQIPSSVPSLRRTVRGSNHFKVYSGEIVSINNTAKTVTVNLDNTTKSLAIDELRFADFGQNRYSHPILSNTSGNTNVVIQFPASSNISNLTLGRFSIANVINYPGAFLPDKTKNYTVKKLRGVLGQNIVAGNIYPVLTMQDASSIPDTAGELIFNFGYKNEEAEVKYFGRPNNTTLLLDPSYNFLKNHSIGELVNVIVKPYQNPNSDGSDYSTYLVGVTAARVLAQTIVESVAAAGVIIRWIVVQPKC